MRDLLVRWLAPAGYDIREAPDADTALDLVIADPPNVVLCDVQMPGRDGLWLVERMRERLPDVAVVLATAVRTVPPVMSLREGVVEYLVKPFERERVLSAVRRAVEWHQAAVAGRPDHAGGDPVEEWLNDPRSETDSPQE